MIKDDDVLSDLMLFENQIPLSVVHVLFHTLFPHMFEPVDNQEENNRQIIEKINYLALSLLGYSPLLLPILEVPHILYLVQLSANRTLDQEVNHIVVDIFDDTTYTRQQQLQHLKLKRCVLTLENSGVIIESPGFAGLSCSRLVWNSLCGNLNRKDKPLDHIPEPEAKGLDFHFKFKGGKLEIKQLNITKTTKAKWCNLIAFEHNQKIQGKHRRFEEGSSSKFTCAALMFNGLICFEDDVQFLKDKKIVVDHLKMSNQELMEFFRKIALGIDHGVVDSNHHIRMFDHLNNFSYNLIWKTVWNSITYPRHGVLVRFMNRNYNFVATVVSVLTVVQTVYAILAYYIPK